MGLRSRRRWRQVRRAVVDAIVPAVILGVVWVAYAAADHIAASDDRPVSVVRWRS